MMVGRPTSGRRMRGLAQRFALAGIWLAAVSAAASLPPVAPKPEDQRPAFVPPGIDDPSVVWPDLLDNGILGTIPGIDSTGLTSAAPARWTRQLPPLLPEPAIPPRTAGGWWLGIGGGPGGIAGLDRALGGMLRLRAEGDAWIGRIRQRDHWRMAARLAARDAARLPGWRGTIGLDLGGEGWEAEPAAQRALPGTMHAAALTGAWQRGVVAGDNRFVLDLDVAWARVRTRSCLWGDCGSDRMTVRTGRWRSIGAGLRTAGTARDLRRYAPAGASSRMHGDFELWGGLTHRRSPEGTGEALGRWRTRAVWSVPRDAWQLVAGLSASGEARSTLIAPVLGLRRAWRDRRACAAIELTPDLRFAEDVLARSERLPEVSLIREAPSLPTGPRSPVVYDPRLPPQRAWPVLAGEMLRESDAGWIDLAVTLAHVRDPLDWRPDTLAAGTTLLRATPGASRVLARIALTVEHRFGPGRILAARYRWMRDSRAGDHTRALHALPVHAGEVRWEVADARWRWGLRAEAQSRTPETPGAAAQAATIALAAHLGLALGGTEIGLVAENVFDATARDEPYAPMTRRWVGLEWNLPGRASVP